MKDQVTTTVSTSDGSPLSLYFFSDVHLGSENESRFLSFLEQLKRFPEQDRITHLFLLGDIFDLWVGEGRAFQDKYRAIISEIQRLRSLNIPIYYFEGNHDFHLKSFWEKSLGVQVFTDPAYFSIDQQKVRIEHGDQMDPEDRGYHLLRWFLRTSFIKFLTRVLPSSFIRKMGEFFSHKSRDYTNSLREKKIDKDFKKLIETHLSQLPEVNQLDVSLSGHIHQKLEFTAFRKTKIFNLGSWLFDHERPFLRYKSGVWEFGDKSEQV